MQRYQNIFYEFMNVFLKFVDNYLQHIKILFSFCLAILVFVRELLKFPENLIIYLSIIFIILVLSTFVSLRLIKTVPQIKDLENKIKDKDDELKEYSNQIIAIHKNIYLLFDGFLINLAKKHHVVDDPESRISIYVRDPVNENFVPCGRYSSNADWRKRGREILPGDQGCIAKAWNIKWCFDANFPEDRKNHSTYSQKNYNIDKKIHRNINMLSRLYAVLRLENDEKEHFAIIVFESLNKDRFSEDEIKDILDDVAEKFTDSISVFQKQILTANIKKAKL